MLDIRFIRENPDAVRENIKRKFQDAKLPLVDEVIDLQDKLAVAEEELDRVNDKLEAYQAEQEAAQKALERENQALRALYELQQQYLTLNIEGCAKTIQKAEADGLPAALSDKSEGGVTSPAVRWQQLRDAVVAKMEE